MSSRMGRMTQSGCGCNVFGVGRLDVSGTGETVGIVGLQAILRQLYDSGRAPDDEAVADELLALVKARNYVPQSLETKYRTALLREYGASCARAG